MPTEKGLVLHNVSLCTDAASRVWIIFGDLRIELENSKYLALVRHLIVARLNDAAQGVHPREQGWVEVEPLRRSARVAQLDTALCRVRDAFRDAGLPDYRDIIEVRRGDAELPGARRIAIPAERLFLAS